MTSLVTAKCQHINVNTFNLILKLTTKLPPGDNSSVYTDTDTPLLQVCKEITIS